jgi:uncharacterized protein YndB with AHSA1/START domain
MQTLHFSILINAPKEKVWNTMLEDETYREWTSAFSPEGSYYEGGWNEGDEILFLGGDGNKEGAVSGMISRIKESKPFDFVSIQHLGEIHNGEKKLWYGEGTVNSEAFENYTFEEKDGGTEVIVDLTASDGFPYNMEEMFKDMWPKALQSLKEIAER